MGFGGRHKASHLRQNDNQRRLAHVGRFAGHIGTREHNDLIGVGVEMAVIGNESAAPGECLDDRVASFANRQIKAAVHVRPDEAIRIGHLSQR